MSQVLAVDSKIVKNILSTLQELREELARLNQKFEKEPPYGSDEWWEWSDKKAMEEIKQGKGIVLHNKKELKGFFKNLQDA